MKIILSFTAFMLLFLGVSVSAPAQSTSDVFLMPDGRVGQAYQLDIEALLREKYRLKIDTGTRESILQWSLVDGELPAGLTLRTNGTVAGTPETPRQSPYLFRVRVIDRAATADDALIISLSLVVSPPRLRLTRIEGPMLVPVDNNPPASRTTGSQPREVVRPPEPKPSPAPPPAAAINRQNEMDVKREVTNQSSGNRGIFKKVVGVVGLGNGDDKPKKSKNCDSKDEARIVISDEVHNPIEGDTSTQSTCVEFQNLNTLKYRFEFNTKTTRTEAPDLASLPFLPKLDLTKTTPATPPSGQKPSSAFVKARIAGEKNTEKATSDAEDAFSQGVNELNERFIDARDRLNYAEMILRQDVETPINNMTSALENAHAQSKTLANSADSYLQADNTKGLLDGVHAVLSQVNSAIDTTWPGQKILDVTNILDDVTAKLEDLRGSVTEDIWKEWLVANQDRYNRVRDRVTELKGKVSSLNSQAIDDAKKVLSGWQSVLKNVDDQGDDAFVQRAFVSCHTDEGESKSSKLTLTKTDRTVDNASAISREVLTVNCYSRVAITAGFNFSTLDEKDFSVVQSAGTDSGTTVKKFGFTNRSNFRPNPLALVNIRFTNNPEYNWHASFGAVVDLKGQTGTDVEPVAGVSFSIRRLLFITPFALHFGRVNKLAGGFKEGDVVPDSIATPPIEKSWKIGYTGGITFRIAPQ